MSLTDGLDLISSQAYGAIGPPHDGEHFCLGAHLARRSQRALFRELGRRLEHIERAGDPEWIQSSFVVGLKRLPVRYRFARGA